MLPLLQLYELSRRLPPCAVFSGFTAAWLHGLDVPPCDPVEVTLPRLSRTSRLAGMALKRSDLTPGEAVRVSDLRSTSATRTTADLGRRLSLVEAVVILDIALHRRITDLGQLRTWIDSHPGYHGLRRLRQAIELAEPAAESAMETRMRLLLRANGLPKPEVQTKLYDADGTFLARADLYYPSHLLAIEYDGASHRTSLAADNRRQNDLLEAGYHLLRFTAADIYRTPASVVGKVERALGGP